MEIVGTKNEVIKALLELEDKKYRVDIKEYREKRSLDANAYMWKLCQLIAEVIRSDKDSVYLDMLGKYGVFTHVIAKPNVVERIKSEWRLVKDLGEVTVNEHKGIQLQCYFGSSTYDTKEMSKLIDGIVREAKDLGVKTLDDLELEKIKGEWGI